MLRRLDNNKTEHMIVRIVISSSQVCRRDNSLLSFFNMDFSPQISQQLWVEWIKYV